MSNIMVYVPVYIMFLSTLCSCLFDFPVYIIFLRYIGFSDCVLCGDPHVSDSHPDRRHHEEKT